MKKEHDDPQEPDEYKQVLDNITQRMDGFWLVGFNRKTGKPFARACSRDIACTDALVPFKPALLAWVKDQGHK